MNKPSFWDNKENYELLTKFRTTLNDKDEGVPFTVIGNKTFNGFSDKIAKEIKQTIKYFFHLILL